MHLDQRGHPLHTRALSVTLRTRNDGRLDANAYLLDVRKRVFMPVGGDLQSSGIIHNMLLDAVIDPATRRLDAIEGRQPAVAFEASAMTAGESCRDPIGSLQALVGTTLDDGWAGRLRDAIGGPLGCFHIFTLAHLLGSSVGWALEREQALFDPPLERPASQRVFRRDIIVDGSQLEDRSLVLTSQLIDLHFTAADGRTLAMDRFAECRDVRTQVALDLMTVRIHDPRVAERRRSAARLDGPWRDRPDVATRLTDVPLVRGAAAALLERFPDPGPDAPIVDGLLMLAPALIQIFAAVSDDWPKLAAAERWVVGMSGRPDSCYMWRRDGALAKARAPEDPSY